MHIAGGGEERARRRGGRHRSLLCYLATCQRSLVSPFFSFFFFHFGLPWKMSLNEVLHGLLKTSCDVTMASLGVKRTGTLQEEPFKSLHMKPSYFACWYLKLILKLQFILQHTGMYTLHTLPLYTEHVKWSETALAWDSGANGMLSVSTHRPAQDMQGPLNYCKLLCDIAWLG